jgi:hypothetical protein
MNSDGLSSRLSQIIEARQKLLPAVEARLEAWRGVDEALGELDAALVTLAAAAPADLADLPIQFRRLGLPQVVQETLRRLRILAARFGRESLNLGVSGQARVGKSTLLQAITGLDDEQVPTGQGHPVTAVRSQIFHSANQARGLITLHGFTSFRDEVLGAYHDELGLTERPRTVEQFGHWPYPDAMPDEGDQPDAVLSRRGLLQRLRGMQEGLDVYGSALTGEVREVALDDLRPYLAYPEGDAATPPGLYLAVRQAHIECPFPLADVERLSLLDLPGLGELAAGAERRHVEGLQNDVDVVLLVMRPQATSAFVDDKTYKTLDRLHEASEAFSKKEDFVFLVVNDGDVEAPLVEALIGDIEERLTSRKGAGNYAVLRANAKNPDEVHRQIMAPVLAHLAERLPQMDREVMAHALERGGHPERIKQAISEIRADLLGRLPELVAVDDELDRRTEELRKDISDALTLLLEQLFQAARNEDGDEDFVQAVERAATESESWIDHGFGKGTENWIRDASRTIRLYKGSGGFVADEFNRIRVEISQQFGKLDDFFARRLAEMHERIGSILTESLGQGLVGTGGSVALRRLISHLTEAGTESCPALARSLGELLDVRLDYRTQLHPRLRRCLDGLVAQYRDPRTGQVKPAVTADAEGAEDLYRQMRLLAIQAVYQIKKELHRDAAFPSMVIHAAAEQFDDAFLRGGQAKPEFKRLTRAYRDDIWPGAFEGLDAHNARVGRVRQWLNTVEQRVSAIENLNLDNPEAS